MQIVPSWLAYLLLCLTAAVENVFPPFPGDTITVFGAYLAGRGFLDPVLVFLWTAAGNFSSNLILYYLGLRQGRDFIKRHKRLFHPDLLPRVALFYRKWGVWTIIFSRFLVGVRSVVPLFAGISRFRARRFILPVACSIAVQHALQVYLGYTLGQRWDYIKTILKEMHLILGLVTLIVLAAAIVIFRRIKRSRASRARRNRL